MTEIAKKNQWQFYPMLSMREKSIGWSILFVLTFLSLRMVYILMTDWNFIYITRYNHESLQYCPSAKQVMPDFMGIPRETEMYQCFYESMTKESNNHTPFALIDSPSRSHFVHSHLHFWFGRSILGFLFLNLFFFSAGSYFHVTIGKILQVTFFTFMVQVLFLYSSHGFHLNEGNFNSDGHNPNILSARVFLLILTEFGFSTFVIGVNASFFKFLKKNPTLFQFMSSFSVFLICFQIAGVFFLITFSIFPNGEWEKVISLETAIMTMQHAMSGIVLYLSHRNYKATGEFNAIFHHKMSSVLWFIEAIQIFMWFGIHAMKPENQLNLLIRTIFTLVVPHIILYILFVRNDITLNDCRTHVGLKYDVLKDLGEENGAVLQKKDENVIASNQDGIEDSELNPSIYNQFPEHVEVVLPPLFDSVNICIFLRALSFPCTSFKTFLLWTQLILFTWDFCDHLFIIEAKFEFIFKAQLILGRASLLLILVQFYKCRQNWILVLLCCFIYMVIMPKFGKEEGSAVFITHLRAWKTHGMIIVPNFICYLLMEEN